MKIPRSFVALVVLSISIVSTYADAPLRKGDQFDLRIGGVPADQTSLISSSYTVDGEGCLNLAYIGKIQVDGKTPSQAQSSIEQAYVERGIYTHPTVTIAVAPSARLITVGGEVNNKGRIQYNARYDDHVGHRCSRRFQHLTPGRTRFASFAATK